LDGSSLEPLFGFFGGVLDLNLGGRKVFDHVGRIENMFDLFRAVELFCFNWTGRPRRTRSALGLSMVKVAVCSTSASGLDLRANLLTELDRELREVGVVEV
jgi:hypothetical protein